jgi:hypothetical protein
VWCGNTDCGQNPHKSLPAFLPTMHFRPLLNMKPFFCWSPWLNLCPKPARTIADVEAHYEQKLNTVYRNLVIAQAVLAGSNRWLARFEHPDYFEQQSIQQLNNWLWTREHETRRHYDALLLNYASELSHALHYERLVKEEAERQRKKAELERRWEREAAERAARDEEDAAKIAAALETLPAHVSPATRACLTARIKFGLINARFRGLPRALRRIIKGLPLIEAGV